MHSPAEQTQIPSLAAPQRPSQTRPSSLLTRLNRWRRSPVQLRETVLIAEELLGLDRLIETLEVVARGQKHAPEHMPLRVLEGRAWMKLGELDRAQSTLYHAAQMAPDAWEPFRYLGQVMLKSGDPTRALKLLNRAQALNPDHQDILRLKERATRLASLSAKISPATGLVEQEETSDSTPSLSLSMDSDALTSQEGNDSYSLNDEGEESDILSRKTTKRPRANSERVMTGATVQEPLSTKLDEDALPAHDTLPDSHSGIFARTSMHEREDDIDSVQIPHKGNARRGRTVMGVGALALLGLAAGTAWQQEWLSPSSATDAASPASSLTTASDVAQSFTNKAKIAAKQGNWKRAETLAQRALHHDPTHDTQALLATILLSRGHASAAFQSLESDKANKTPALLRLKLRSALRAGSENTLDWVEETLAQQPKALTSTLRESAKVHLHLARGQFADAAKQAQAIASPTNDNEPEAVSDIAQAKALAALAVLDTHSAQEVVNAWLNKQPQSPEAWLLQAQVQRIDGDVSEAKKSLNQAIAHQPHHLDASLALAAILQHEGKSQKALELYQKLQRDEVPRHQTRAERDILLGRIEAHIALSQLDQADAHMQAFASQFPPSRRAIAIEARLRLAQNRVDEARTLLRNSIDDNNAPPPSADLVSTYALALEKHGDYEEAHIRYAQAIQQDAHHPEALMGLARATLRAENPNATLSWLKRARQALDVRIRPTTTLTELELLEGQAYLQKPKEFRVAAERVLRAASKREQAPPEVWFFLGESLAGRAAAEARRAYSRYLETSPNGLYAKRARRASR